MKNIRLIHLEWNEINGLTFGFFGINNYHLLSWNSAFKHFCIIEILFIRFTIYDLTE